MKFSLFFAVLATVSSMVAPVASAPIVQERAVEKRASTGKGTWYDVGLGACGKRNTNSQPIIAVNHVQWSSKLCGKWITVKNTKNGKSTSGYVEDMCPGCKRGDLDLSPAVFKKMASLGTGVINISWGTPSSKRSEDEGNFVIRAGIPEDDPNHDAEYDDPDYKFDPADALSEEDLAELLNAGSDEETPDVADAAASLTS